MKLKFLFFLILIKSLLYSETEIGIYSFNFNKKIKTSGTKVYFFSEDNAYIELQDILKIIGITNNSWINETYIIDLGNIYNQEKSINLERKYIDTNGKKTKYTDEIIEKNEKIYVKLEYLPHLLSIKSLEKDDDKLTISVDTLFRLPIELSNIREYRKEEFKKSEKKNQKKIYTNPKFFEPGNLRLVYDYRKNFQASNYESKSVNTEYLGPLFYGDFETYYGIYPDLENYQTRLTYRNVYNEHALIFGDISVNLPRILSGTVGGIRGISFSKDYKLVGEYDNNSITISGYAPLGKFVELYRDNKLLSYEDVKNGQYKFEQVPLLFLSDSFYVLIYNQDGSVTKEYLNRYYGEKPEKEGEFGFNFHVGESKYDRYDQFIAEVNYGLTQNITLKAGYYDLKYNAFYTRDNPQENQTGKLGLLYVSDYGKAPFNLEINGYRNNQKDTDFTYRYNQVFQNYRLNFEGAEYSSSTEKRLNKKNEFALELSRNKFLRSNINMGLKYYSTKYSYNEEVNEIGAVFRASLRNLVPEYGVYTNVVNGNTYHDFNIRSYYFRNYSIYAGVTHRTIGEFNETRYKLEVISRYNRDNGLRYRAYYEKSDRYGDVFGIAFELDYNSWFSGSANYTKSNGISSIDSGFTLDKVINLSDVNSKVTYVENAAVKGIVYVDNNNDGVYEANVDRLLPRAEVKINGKSSITDENGEYKINDLSSSTIHELKVNTQNPIYKGKVDIYKITPNPASTLNLNIPVYARKIISGMINFENNTLMNKYLKTLYLSVIDMKTNKKLEITIPENDGFFIIDSLIGGKYKLTLESIEIPGKVLLEKEIDLDSEIKELNIELNIGGKDSENKNELVFDIVVNNN